MNKEKIELIKQQYEELHKKFRGLKLYEDSPGQWVIRGVLAFTATYNEVTIEDEYSVLISLPKNYPDTPPDVQETGGRIPPEFHQYADRTLCLGAPVEVERRFKADPKLINFIETLLIEYLYGYSHFKKYGELPFGELSHGGSGIQEYYQDLFNTDDIKVVFKLLKILVDGTYRGHHVCPCKSGKILRKCHGPKLLELAEYKLQKKFIGDVKNIICGFKEKDLYNLNWGLLPKQLKYEFDNTARKTSPRKKY